MPKLVRISYRKLAAKLRHAGYIEIQTLRRAIVREMGLSVEEFNGL